MNKKVTLQDTIDSLSELDIYVGKGYLSLPKCSVDTLTKPVLVLVKDNDFGEEKYLTPEARYVFETLQKKMDEKKQAHIYLNSPYRSVQEQFLIKYSCAGGTLLSKTKEQIKNHNFSCSSIIDAVSKRMDTVADYNMSEHTTGLAMDLVKIEDGIKVDLTPEDRANIFEAANENIKEFGLILRYTDGKRNVTGYPYEKHHFRVLDKEQADYIHQHKDSSYTLEEYFNEVLPLLSKEEKHLVNIYK